MIELDSYLGSPGFNLKTIALRCLYIKLNGAKMCNHAELLPGNSLETLDESQVRKIEQECRIQIR